MDLTTLKNFLGPWAKRLGGGEAGRILGILVIFLVVYVLTWIMADAFSDRASFMTGFNQQNLLRRTALYGILGIGVAFVIITGGIDLSLGSMVCLVGVGVPFLLVNQEWPLLVVLLLVLLVPFVIGLSHGLLITKLSLQPFIVTLCGLLIYRGVTRGFTQDTSVGFLLGYERLRWFGNGEIPVPFIRDFGIPIAFVIFVILAVLASIFLNKTIYGRYLLALGNNEEATRLSGVNTDRMVITAYVICAMFAGVSGFLFILDNGNAQPVDFGNFYELFAIAAAVLGGCSLRGGRGTIIGVVLGTALIQVLRNMINIVFPKYQYMEYAVIGVVIIVGVIADELAKRAVAKQRLQSR